MGLFAALMGQNQQQPQGYTYPGAGSPPPMNTQITPGGGVPQLPQAPSPGAQAGGMRPMMPPQQGAMPAGASGTPQNGSGMFQGLANNPMLMMALRQQMGGGGGGNGGMPSPGQTGPAQTGGSPMPGGGAFPAMPGAQGGAPGGAVPTLADASANAAGGGQQTWLQQLLARLQGGGGGAPQ